MLRTAKRPLDLRPIMDSQSQDPQNRLRAYEELVKYMGTPLASVSHGHKPDLNRAGGYIRTLDVLAFTPNSPTDQTAWVQLEMDRDEESSLFHSL